MRLILTAILSLWSILPLTAKTQNYGEDAAFLSAHTPLVELQSGQAVVAIAPAYQARVMTSSPQGPEGGQYGIFFEPGAVFEHYFSVTNHSGTHFDLSGEREIRLLDRETLLHAYGLSLRMGYSSFVSR